MLKQIMIMIIISYNVLQKSLIFQKISKYSPAKYALLLYLAVSIQYVSLRFDSDFSTLTLLCLSEALYYEALRTRCLHWFLRSYLQNSHRFLLEGLSPLNHSGL